MRPAAPAHSVNSYNGFTSSQREKAQRWLNAEVAAGRLSWPTRCDICADTAGPFDFHAEDYSEPFGPKTHQFGLCKRCHGAIHRRFAFPDSFDQYVRGLVASRIPDARPDLLTQIAAHEFDPRRNP